ncbi:MAG: hypothetical protein E6I70_05165 [Chloroflexi bacterium]|nr:MAG: hypothetical protein E6I63_06710 [Chloroflexota bacterium]TME19048.1 MAG: hypothetical protein E6I70_05165 [Chloroflexota bacterium]
MTRIVETELEALDGLWESGLGEAYGAYLAGGGRPETALAAALVEVAVRLQGLGGAAASPPDLLRGDLCLARASRLLAQNAGLTQQVAFARTIEDAAAAAAAGRPLPPVRERLLEALAA